MCMRNGRRMIQIWSSFSQKVKDRQQLSCKQTRISKLYNSNSNSNISFYNYVIQVNPIL